MNRTEQELARHKITERGLYQRINRKLKSEGEQLRTTRSAQAEMQLGRYYCVNTYNNYIAASHIDLEAWGRELGVIQPWEQVVT